MLAESFQKELILKNALTRIRRASLFVDSSLRRRRQQILAANSTEGHQYFLAMKQALTEFDVDIGACADATETMRRSSGEKFKIDVQRFISEPAQKIAIGQTLNSRQSHVYSLSKSQGVLSPSHSALIDTKVGDLAWGAFSLKKLSQSCTPGSSKSTQARLTGASYGNQLNLEDLAVIDCAVCYRNDDFDYYFMTQLSAGGAEVVHRVAMIIARDYYVRVDKAIVAAAKMLLDPIVGGDADHCCSMLKQRQIPTSWAHYCDLR
ncbi:hypothetical protein [Pseudomonas sp. GM_Psu_2]|uniref:hypothetical protein n=1 Tax=unclassified Pseudomonas TaxID=196821 RepID=UPI00226A4826|nr:hypothetical protein [Pseudomonas sp. GM_Psu_2]